MFTCPNPRVLYGHMSYSSSLICPCIFPPCGGRQLKFIFSFMLLNLNLFGWWDLTPINYNGCFILCHDIILICSIINGLVMLIIRVRLKRAEQQTFKRMEQNLEGLKSPNLMQQFSCNSTQFNIAMSDTATKLQSIVNATPTTPRKSCRKLKNCFTKQDVIMSRWTEYCTELYNHTGTGDTGVPNVINENELPQLLIHRHGIEAPNKITGHS